MSDGTEAVSKAASTARNRFTCWAETPLVSPREYSRSSPLWRKRRIIGEKCDVSHYTCQASKLIARPSAHWQTIPMQLMNFTAAADELRRQEFSRLSAAVT